MSDADALLAAVLADPDADLPRLVFADHLDDAGHPARAEFIRVQCARAADPAHPHLEAREKTLLALHAADWLKPLRARGEPLQSSATHGRFRRGFVEEVWMPARVFARKADKLFRRAPVRALRVTQAASGELLHLFADPVIGRLREIDVAGLPGDELVVAALTAAAHRLPAVLRVRNCDLTDVEAELLADVAPLWRPTELDVSLNPLTEAGLGLLRARYGAAVRFDR